MNFLVGLLTKEEYKKLIEKNNQKNLQNIQHARLILERKSKNSEFYYKLNGLNDKIRHYKIKFDDWDEDNIPLPRDRTPEEQPEKRRKGGHRRKQATTKRDHNGLSDIASSLILKSKINEGAPKSSFQGGKSIEVKESHLIHPQSIDLDLDKVIEEADRKHRREKRFIPQRPHMKKKNFEALNRNLSTGKCTNDKDNILLNTKYSVNEKGMHHQRSTDNLNYKSQTLRDKGENYQWREQRENNKRYIASLSPDSKDESISRPRQIPDHQRMKFLSQPKKATKNKKKSRKKKLNVLKEPMLFPSIRSPTSTKNSVVNIQKAKIYGIELDKFPNLKKHNKKYSDFVKKIRNSHRANNKRSKKMVFRTVNNSPEPKEEDDREKELPDIAKGE